MAAKISGEAAKNIAILLYTILKQEQKTKGKARLSSMLKSGKELKVFTIQNQDLKKFTKEAKRYGVLYCVLRDKRNKQDPNGIVDVIARAEDASKISRIIERYNMVGVDSATIISNIAKTRETKGEVEKEPKERMKPDKDSADKLLDEILEKPKNKEKGTTENPSLAKTEKSPLSEHSLTSAKSREEGGREKKPSVRKQIREIDQERKRTNTDREKKPMNRTQRTVHRQPKRRSRKVNGKVR